MSFGSKILKCAPEQLRRLTPEDEAAIRLIPPELVDWSHETSKRGVATFHDISMEGKPSEEKSDYWELNGNVLRRIHVDERQYQYVPRVEDQPPVELELLLSDRRTAIESHVAPTRFINDDWRAMGRGERMETGWTGYTEFRWKRRREENNDMDNDLIHEFSSEPGAAVGAATVEEQHENTSEADMLVTPEGTNDTIQPSTASQSQGSDFMEEDETTAPLIEVISGPTTVTEPIVSNVPSAEPSSYGPIRETGLTRALRQDAQRLDGHRPTGHAVTSDVLSTELCNARWIKKANGWKIDWEAGMIIKLHDWRRTKYTPTQRECPIPFSWLTGRRHTLIRLENRDQGFQVIEDDFHQDKSTKVGYWWAGYTIFEFDGMPRMDEIEDEEYEVNEVTLTEIQSERQQLWEGKKSELEKLLRFEAVRVVLPTEARQVRKATNRILPSRFVITKKPCDKEPGRYVTKARWCIRGYLDPDLLKMDTQAPTLSNEALSLVLQLAASRQWELTIADIEGAFLQGDSLKREDGDVYVELPPGGIPGLPEGTLLKLLKPVYGLSDAPRAWFTKLKKTLMQLGLRQSVLDPCLYHYWEKGKLEGSLAVHVDDLITTGSKIFEMNVLKQLKETFPFKHWKHGGGEFLGRTIVREKDGGIRVHQREYCAKLKTIDLDRVRKRNKEDTLTEQESILRGVAGGLNWLTTATRPDLAAQTARVQQHISKGTVQDLIEANKVVAEARDFQNVSIQFQGIPLDELTILVTADASWATEEDLKSRGAYMVCATHRSVIGGDITPVNPLKWKSQKQERAVSSTLAAELYTVSKGVSEAMWMRHFFLETMFENYNLENAMSKSEAIPVVAVTDNKPLYDHARNDQGICQDKRLAIEVLTLRRDLQRHGVTLRWIDTEQMLVDCMTKTSVKPTLMRHVLATGRYAIMQEEQMLEHKRTQRQARKRTV